jgi:hypothetical protein
MTQFPLNNKLKRTKFLDFHRALHFTQLKFSFQNEILLRFHSKNFGLQKNTLSLAHQSQEESLQSSMKKERSQTDLLLALQKRNFFRILFLFFLNQYSSSENKFKFQKQFHLLKFPDLNEKKKGKIGLSRPQIQSPLNTKKRIFGKTFFGLSIQRFFSLWQTKFQGFDSKFFLFQMFCIPYIFLFGILFTFVKTAEQIPSPRPVEISITESKFSQKGPGLGFDTSGFLRPTSSILIQKIENLNEFNLFSFHSSLQLNLGLKKIYFFCFESLRTTNYVSKIFLVWGFLQIWRGIRPGQSALNDTQIQVRIIPPSKNRKSLGAVQGIEKFQKILDACIQGLKRKWRSFPFPFLNSSSGKNFSSVFRYPKGYLFLGPPGSGKTLLAQAIAGEAKVRLISLSASEIQKQIDIGTRIGAIRLRNLFKQARASTPCILFLDEIDSLGSQSSSQSVPSQNLRGQQNKLNEDSLKILKTNLIANSQQTNFDEGNSPSSNAQFVTKALLLRNFFSNFETSNGLNLETEFQREGKQITENIQADRTLLTEFLIQMDSFSVHDGFCVIGTTNFFEKLDSAFIRSGRFDRILTLTYPGKQVRQALLEFYANRSNSGGVFSKVFKKSSGNQNIDWNLFAEKTQGFSAADISKVINESRLFMIYRHVFMKTTKDSDFQNIHTVESIQKGIEKISSRENFGQR